ncbi:ESPR domain-containing protein, partial [Megasphaera stantonii]|uniref:ESPR domain-containing protein n=1 Tax=Megasphaera stantonii TaxID=2144175 RepID=UPI00294250A5
MNRIYKVIWSKVKHQYVVVSELAHSCTKSTSSCVGRSTAAVLAALVLTMGVGSVQAEEIGGVKLENNSVTATTVNSYSTVTQGATVTNHLQSQTAEIKDLTIRSESGMETTATLDSSGNFDTVGKIAGASGEFGGFTFEDGVMKTADGSELSIEDIKGAAEALEGVGQNAADIAANKEAISDLQATDSRQDGQISDLQATDSRQDGQISDLQATDSRQDGQISDLQAT